MSLARPAATVIVVAPFQALKITANTFQTNYRIFMLKRSKESKFMGGAFAILGALLACFTVVAQAHLCFLEGWPMMWITKLLLLDYLVSPQTATISRTEFVQSVRHLRRVGLSFSKTWPALHSFLTGARRSTATRRRWPLFASNFNVCQQLSLSFHLRVGSPPFRNQNVRFRFWTLFFFVHGNSVTIGYDTYFYIANSTPFLELQGVDSVIHDGLETVNSKWFAPDEAIQEFERGNIFLAPPTWFILRHLAQFKSMDQLLLSLLPDSPVPVTQPNIVKLSTEQQTAQKALFTANNLEGLKDPVIIALPGDVLHHDSPAGTTVLNRIEIGSVHGKLTYNHVCTVKHPHLRKSAAFTVPAKL